MKHYTITLIAILLLLPSLILARDDTQIQPSTPTITSLAWSPDGTKIAASFDDKTVKVWGLNSDGSQFITPPLVTFRPSLVDVVKWTSDSKFLVSQGHTKEWIQNGTIDADVSKWDAQTGKFVEQLFDYHIATKYEFNPYAYYVFPAIGFDSTFTRSAFSLNSNEVTLSWEAVVFFIDFGTVKDLMWSPDDSHLAIIYGNEDHFRIQTYDLSTNELINTIWGPDYYLTDITWSSDNAYLAVTSVWASNPPTTQVRLYSVVKGRDHLTDEDMFFAFDNTLRGESIKDVPPATAWYPKANILAVSSPIEINFYAVPSKESIKTITAENIVLLTYAPDGKHLAGSDPSGEIRIWDVSDLKPK